MNDAALREGYGIRLICIGCLPTHGAGGEERDGTPSSETI